MEKNTSNGRDDVNFEISEIFFHDSLWPETKFDKDAKNDNDCVVWGCRDIRCVCVLLRPGSSVYRGV